MRNLVILQSFCFNTVPCEILGVWIDEFSRLVVILDNNFVLSVFTYEKVFHSFSLVDTFELDQKVKEEVLLNNSVVQVFIRSETSEVYVFLKRGEVIKINTETKSIETKVLFEEKLIALEISPSTEYIAAATENFRLHLLNTDLEFLKSAELDDGDMSNKLSDNSICSDANISWRGDNQVLQHVTLVFCNSVYN